MSKVLVSIILSNVTNQSRDQTGNVIGTFTLHATANYKENGLCSDSSFFSVYTLIDLSHLDQEILND